MDNKKIIENILKEYNFKKFPPNYKATLIEVINIIENELQDELLSITLGGSAGKDNIIEGWSDLDIYIVVENYNIEKISKMTKELNKKNIHIGLTIYNLYEVENDLIDFKTKIMIYEKNNYCVNPTLYGYDYFNNITYEEVYNNDLMNYPKNLQAFKRMYIDILNKDKKIDKAYIKKMLVLVKCILTSHQIFSFGYQEVLEEFIKIIYPNNLHINFEELLKNLDYYQEYFLYLSKEIIEYTENNQLFNSKKKVKKLICKHSLS